MNITGLILLGAGYLLGNPKARDEAFSNLQKLAGMGIDALNKRGGGDNDVSTPDTGAEAE